MGSIEWPLRSKRPKRGAEAPGDAQEHGEAGLEAHAPAADAQLTLIQLLEGYLRPGAVTPGVREPGIAHLPPCDHTPPCDFVRVATSELVRLFQLTCPCSHRLSEP